MVTHEDQGGVQILVIFLDVVGIVLRGLSIVHRIEVEAGIIGLDGLEEDSECILEAKSARRSAM